MIKGTTDRVNKHSFVYSGTKEVVTLWFVGTFVVILLAHILLTVILPLSLGDGTNNYSGAKREAAQRAADVTYAYIDNKIRWAYKIHVDNVYPTTASEKAQYCTGNRAVISSNPNDPHYYTVRMTIKSLFTYSSTSQERDGCSSLPAGSF